MRHRICDKDYEIVIAVAHACEVFLVTESAGDVSSLGFETCESLSLILHGQSRGRHSLVSLKVWDYSFDQENVSVIDCARAYQNDVNVRR